MKNISILSVSVAVGAIWANAVDGADIAPQKLKSKPTAISLFKNGVGFVVRDAELPRGDVALVLDELPVPVHGTFWIGSPTKDASVREIVAEMAETTERIEAISVDELLHANVGATVELRTSEKEVIRGKILSIPAPRLSKRPEYGPLYLVPEATSIVMVQTASGTVGLNRAIIVQITGVDGPLQTKFDRKAMTPTLRLRASNPEGKGRLQVLYLAKGISWAPSYAVDISDPKTARFAAKAEIINEMEDLDHISVNFITGFPNLQFIDVNDPISLRDPLATFLNTLAHPQAASSYVGLGQAQTQQAITMNSADFLDANPAAFEIGALGGQTREELFFYEQKDVTLKRGGRGYYSLFNADVPYEHIYEWKIGDMQNEEERYRNDPRQVSKAEDVWHSLRLTNNGKVPWTTAPAMTLQGGQILGQDLVYFTPVGGQTTLRVTKALDVKAEQSEVEVERKRNVANFFGTNYDLVDVKGKLHVVNWKDKDIALSITKELSGEVAKATPEAKITLLAKGLKKVNQQSQLTWELSIKAKEKLEVEYTYRVYVRP